MRWVSVVLIFAAGVGVGLVISTLRSNDSSEALASVPAIPGTASNPSLDSENIRPQRIDGFVSTAGNLETFLQLIDGLSPVEQLSAIERWRRENGRAIEAALRIAELRLAQGDSSAAIRGLLASADEVDSLASQAAFERMLADAVDHAARELTARGDGDALDLLLEEITLALPELGIYFLRLGTLRVQAGAEDGALAVLSQIQNHAEFGAAAREMLNDLASEHNDVIAGVETLPLRRRGDQFIVEASLGNGNGLSLLIDTGASMTVVSRQRLESLGYAINGPTTYFSTAGGVVEGPVMTLERLSLGAAAVHQLPVGVLPIDLPGEIDGLLGMNFLRYFEFRIDQESARLSLDSAKKPPD